MFANLFFLFVESEQSRSKYGLQPRIVQGENTADKLWYAKLPNTRTDLKEFELENMFIHLVV